MKQRLTMRAACNSTIVGKGMLRVISLVIMLAPGISPGQAIPDTDVRQPYQGMWYFPGAVGSGLVLDWERDTLIATIYTYDASGEPVWYLASGPIVDGRFSEKALRFSGGACIGCPWKHPDNQPVANLELDFVGNNIGWFQWDDGAPKAMRSLPFDQPRYSSYGRIGPFDATTSYDLRGRWLIVDRSGEQPPIESEFYANGFGDGGGVATLSWFASDGNHHIYCTDWADDDPNTSQCQYEQLLTNGQEDVEILFSFFWADSGPQRLHGYSGEPLEPSFTEPRRDNRYLGFRITGPGPYNMVEDFESIEPLGLHKGMWYTPGEPGSGLMLDWQNGTVIIAVFTYQEGMPIWYLGAGEPTDNGVLSIELDRYSGGACPNCEYAEPRVAETSISATFRFDSATIGTMTIGEGEEVRMRALPFDSPKLAKFGSPGPFGQPLLYDLAGDWVFVSDKGTDELYKRVTFERLNRIDDQRISWQSDNRHYSLHCDARPNEFDSPQCKFLEFSEQGVERHFSAHWADIGPDQIIAYLGPPKKGKDYQFRGQRRVWGFRISR